MQTVMIKNILKNIWFELMVLLILIGAGGYWFHLVEWWSYFTSLYVTVITIGSVWYGDIVPVTDIGKMLSMFYALIGVPMYVFTSSIIIIGWLNGLKDKSTKRKHVLEVRSGVKGLIQYEGKYLFLKQEILGKLYRDLPGGMINYGEVPLYSLRREIFEETGLDVDILGNAGLWHFFTKDTRAQIVSHIYLCSLAKKQTVKLNKDTNSGIIWYVWTTLDEILVNKECRMDDTLRDVLTDIQKQ